jgi:hypothetical protein
MEMDVIERLISGDAIAGSQYYESRKGQDENAPLRRLMLAVLGDALDCLRSGASIKPSGSRHKASHEAAAWVSDKSDENLFSFNNVCETLGIHPDALREALTSWLACGPRLSRRPPVIRQTSVRLSPYRIRKSRPDARELR